MSAAMMAMPVLGIVPMTIDPMMPACAAAHG
jgi:hypothetical protein